MKACLQTLVLGFSIVAAGAQTATYTFESAQFVPSTLSPYLNKTPDTGPAGFLASFTSSPTATGFFVGSEAAPTSFFSGKYLMSPLGGPVNTLTVTLNSPVSAVQLDFPLMAPGRLELQSSAGNGVGYNGLSNQGGSLLFQSPTSFTQFNLLGFGDGTTRLPLAIDNLVLTIVPEPSLAVLGLVALAFLGRKSWRRGRGVTVSLD